jgi:hypothetical protein
VGKRVPSVEVAADPSAATATCVTAATSRAPRGQFAAAAMSRAPRTPPSEVVVEMRTPRRGPAGGPACR